VPETDPAYIRRDDVADGQAEVDRLVGEVRKIWNSTSDVVATVDPALQRDVELIRAINEKYLADLGDPPTRLSCRNTPRSCRT